MPLDVSRLQPKQLVAEPNVIVADGAPTLIGAQHGGAKVRISRNRGVSYHPLPPQPDRGANVIVE